MKRVTVSDIMAAEPCHEYSRKRVETLWAGREALDAAEIAALDIPIVDRLWAVVNCCLDNRQRRLFSCNCADAALTLVAGPDPRIVDSVRVSRLYADGRAADAQLDACWDAGAAFRAAIWSCWDAGAAAGAAWDAGDASRAASRNAARVAAMDAARVAQLANAVRYAMDGGAP